MWRIPYYPVRMPRFAANLSMLFTELDFPDRFRAAAQAGFKGVECLFPYSHDPGDLARLLAGNGLAMVLFDLVAGDWDAGDRGIACDPARVAEFQDSVALAIEYARALACPRVNCLAGKVPSGVDRATARRTFIANLRHAAAELGKAGVGLVIEPINNVDTPGFFLTGAEQALAIIADAGVDNLRLQYDIYHAQRMHGELGGTLSRHVGSIGHIQIADNPGRHEPGTGEINYRWLLDHIDAIGYPGWVGCEYRPLHGTQAGLAWMDPWRAG